MKPGDFFYDKHLGVFGTVRHVSMLSIKGALLDEANIIHFSPNCIVLYPDTPDNRLAFQLKYSGT
jgi:hypothetical protein